MIFPYFVLIFSLFLFVLGYFFITNKIPFKEKDTMFWVFKHKKIKDKDKLRKTHGIHSIIFGVVFLLIFISIDSNLNFVFLDAQTWRIIITIAITAMIIDLNKHLE